MEKGKIRYNGHSENGDKKWNNLIEFLITTAIDIIPKRNKQRKEFSMIDDIY